LYFTCIAYQTFTKVIKAAEATVACSLLNTSGLFSGTLVISALHYRIPYCTKYFHQLDAKTENKTSLGLALDELE